MGRAGETVCDRAVQIVCGDDASAKSRMNCMTEPQCLAGIAAGKCASCDPGTVRCTEAMLEECGMDGEFAVKETCPSAALCSKTNKSCNPAECEAGAYDCDDSGALRMCKEDRTEFMVAEMCDSPMLCDAAGKKCNACTPGSNMCESDTTLVTCSADGRMMMRSPCMDPTPKCAMASNKCVQCTAAEDCKTTNECMVKTCNMGTGMCSAETPKPRGTACNGGMCDLTGACAECLDDNQCDSSERCVAGVGCVPRFALEITPLLSGSFLINVSPGYGAKIQGSGGGGGGGGSASVSTNLPMSDCIARIGAGDSCMVGKNTTGDVATITIRGPSQQYCGLNGLLAGDNVTMNFGSRTLAADAGLFDGCDDFSIRVSAY
jgi:hypothetical protein